MARIRTIKPEFFTSASVLDLEPLARLFFIGLWCESDREGRLTWKPKTLKFRYLPADDVNIDQIADQLIRQNLITIYQVNGVEYCQVNGFSEHQVINNREKDSTLPSIFDASSTRESGVKAEGRKEGREGKGMEGNNALTTQRDNLAALDFSSWPYLPDQQLLKDWLKAKKQAKGSLSQTAITTVGKQLHIAINNGWTVEECLEQAENSKWKGFKAEWMGVKSEKRESTSLQDFVQHGDF